MTGRKWHHLANSWDLLCIAGTIFTQASLIKVLDEAKKMPFSSSYKRLIFAFAGHGNEKGQIITSEGKTVSIEEIIDCLSKSNDLQRMPKIFFFDACRGKKEDTGRMMPIARGGEKAPTVRVSVSASNYLVAYSTIDGYRSYEENGGGIWMQCVARKLLAENKSIMDVLTAVNEEMNAKFQNPKYCFQVPELTSRLTEPVNLFMEGKGSSW